MKLHIFNYNGYKTKNKSQGLNPSRTYKTTKKKPTRKRTGTNPSTEVNKTDPKKRIMFPQK